jgi:hypothetical protein
MRVVSTTSLPAYISVGRLFGKYRTGTQSVIAILAFFGVGFGAMMITIMMGEGVGTFFVLWLVVGVPLARSLHRGY